MDDRTFCDVIREAVVESGLTCYGLGRAADVAPAVIQRFLAGERGLNLSTAEKLARILDLRLLKVEKPRIGPADPNSLDGNKTGRKRGNKSRLRKHRLVLEKDGVVRVGDAIRIRLLDVRNKSVRFAVELPSGASIMRGELLDAVKLQT